jgi:phage-related protein
MIVNSYETSNRKNVIREYINKLTQDERTEAFKILEELQLNGINALQFFDTRQLKKKLWEIKFYNHNRIFYVVADVDNLYLLHACKKQKGKAEKFELDKAIKRAKELGRALNKDFV